MAASLQILLTVLILYWHIDPPPVNICTKKKKPTIYIYFTLLLYMCQNKYANQIVHKCHIFHWHMWAMNVHIWASYQVTGINHVILQPVIWLDHQLVFNQSTSISILRLQINNCCDQIVKKAIFVKNLKE